MESTRLKAMITLTMVISIGEWMFEESKDASVNRKCDVLKSVLLLIMKDEIDIPDELATMIGKKKYIVQGKKEKGKTNLFLFGIKKRMRLTEKVQSVGIIMLYTKRPLSGGIHPRAKASPLRDADSGPKASSLRDADSGLKPPRR
ncbi:kinase [Striga asiatica]|uniref:Kinase n=1 Tax=Striga asiatica TaxID=4170 RepID=A0A5A7PID3_STRAF|nr:kinase [Striga asiatica]